MDKVRLPKPQQELSALGFPNAAIRPGTKWRAWGADFYVDLLADLEKSGQEIDFYQRSGVFLLKKDETKLEELYQLAFQRREEYSLINQLAILDPASANELFPGLQAFDACSMLLVERE